MHSFPGLDHVEPCSFRTVLRKFAITRWKLDMFSPVHSMRLALKNKTYEGISLVSKSLCEESDIHTFPPLSRFVGPL